MNFVVNMISKKKAGELANFLESSVRRHLESWSNEHNTGTFELRWVAGRLILKTDSETLVQLWNTIESQYVAHILGDQDNIETVKQFTSVAA